MFVNSQGDCLLPAWYIQIIYLPILHLTLSADSRQNFAAQYIRRKAFYACSVLLIENFAVNYLLSFSRLYI